MRKSEEGKFDQKKTTKRKEMEEGKLNEKTEIITEDKYIMEFILNSKINRFEKKR